MAMHVFGKRLAVAAMAAGAIAMGSASAQAGFFDQLFGGFAQQAPAPQATPGYSQSQDNLGFDQVRPAHRAKKKIALVDKAPTLQKTTDLMSDKTLRYGDMVMMKSGLHIYTGLESSHHDAAEFAALDDVHNLSKQKRGELTAIDMTHRAPLSFVASNDVQEGRSAAGGPAISQGYKITDARGRSIRYVGP